jgi:hypothetical protein
MFISRKTIKLASLRSTIGCMQIKYPTRRLKEIQSCTSIRLTVGWSRGEELRLECTDPMLRCPGTRPSITFWGCSLSFASSTLSTLSTEEPIAYQASTKGTQIHYPRKWWQYLLATTPLLLALLLFLFS